MRGKNQFIVLLLAVCLVLIGVNLVFGAHTSRALVGTTVNQSQNYLFNISVNNTGVDEGGNITTLNITLPSGIFFVSDGSNGSSAFGSFSNTSDTLSWTNITNYLINGSMNDYSTNASANFWFNTTISSTMASGYYNITIRSINTTGGYAYFESNVSIKVNDLTAPVITLISPTDANVTITAPTLTFSYNVTDVSTVSNCTLILNGARVNTNTTMNSIGGTNTFTNISYVLTNTWGVNCTDIDNNVANSSVRTLTFVSIEFNGTVKDENGNALNNSIVNTTIRSQAGFSVLAYTSGTSNASGWFNFSIPSNSSWIYEPSILHRNSTTDKVDFKSKTIPAFPSMMVQMLAGTTFYLAPAGTINITAINSSGGRAVFSYQVKDTKLGYPIASEFSTMVSEADIYVPLNRNYSIMIYPNQSMPVSFDWSNFSSSSSYNFNGDSNGINLSSYNVTSRTLNKQFNISMTMAVISGFLTNVAGEVLNNNSINWTNITVIPYLMEPGNMVHLDYGDMPYNLSSANPFSTGTDFFNITSGFYNISLPAPVENSNILLFASAVANNTNYWGGFRNISLSYGGPARQVNFTMFGLLGSANNVTMNRMDGNGQDIAIPTAKQSFNIVNASNATLTSTAGHIEFTVDYSNYNATQFTWMGDIAQSASSATFAIPLINITGFKEVNAFVSGGPSGGSAQYAPKRMSETTISQILENNNITVKLFNPGAIDGTLATSSISIALYSSNATCDVPNPSDTCLLTASSTMATFNPMRAVMGGGKISFRMGYGGILVHYVNVDLLASGPPDALFDSATTGSNSGTSFASAMKFGSSGPTVYDYVLISLPYVETAGSGLNDSAAVSVSIPVLYDDNWNVIWNASANGTNAANLAGNYSHYSTYQNDWGNLTQSKTCLAANVTSYLGINGTNPCHIDNSSNRIWVRLPHFSGTGPSISGNVMAAASTTTTTTSSGGGGTTTAESFWTSTRTITTEQFDAGYSQELGAKARIKFTVGGAVHSVGVISLTDTLATINVSSTPQQATLAIGESKKFELTEDNYFDVKVTLNAISGLKANITVIKINETIPIVATPEAPQTTTEKIKEKINEIAQTATDKGSMFWIIAIVIIVILIVVGIFIKKKVDNIARRKGFR